MPEPTVKLHQIEPVLLPVPPHWGMRGELTLTLKKLAEEGQVGDAFVTDRTPSAVKLCAKMFGMRVLIRIGNPQEKDTKKRVYRVWRCDDLDEDQLNERIQKRLNKEEVPPSPPCVPPPADELAKLKGKKHPKKGK